MQPKRYAHCAAPGCFNSVRPFSRFCPHHYRRLARTRDLRGRIVTKAELRFPRAECLAFIEGHKRNPAVQAALAYMADLIAPTDKATFLRSELDRLRDNGATPETLLASVMALYMWAERNGQWEPGLRPFNRRCLSVNVGRAFLGTVSGRTRVSWTGKTYYMRVKPGHAEALGQNLQDAVGLFCLLAVRKIFADSARNTPDGRGRAIKELLEKAPFDDEGDQQDDEK